MALMEISVVPIGTCTTSLSRHVARVIKLLKERGLPFRIHDMGTTVEGEAKELLKLAGQLHESAFSNEVRRVYTIIKLDDRRDKAAAIGDKVESVERLL